LPSDGRPSHLRLYSLIGLMVFLWSANYVVAKYVLRQMPALLVVGIRTTMAGVAMIPLYRRWVRRNGGHGWDRRDIPLLMFLGLCGVGLNQALFVIGIQQTTVAHAAIMIALTPMLVLVIAAIVGLERLNLARLLGMAVALAGVAVLQSGSHVAGAALAGDLLVLSAAFSFSIFTVRSKAEIHRFGGVTVNTFAYVGSALILMPVTVWLAMGFDFDRVTWTGWTSLVYMALFPSVLCYLIYHYALTHIPASRVSAFAYLQPLIAILLAIPVLGEHPTSALLAGGALVLAGVFTAERV
jgi:drug/metabolite transporter (DMT)-like permease